MYMITGSFSDFLELFLYPSTNSTAGNRNGPNFQKTVGKGKRQYSYR
jgi:hypothetical protein